METMNDMDKEFQMPMGEEKDEQPVPKQSKSKKRKLYKENWNWCSYEKEPESVPISEPEDIPEPENIVPSSEEEMDLQEYLRRQNNKKRKVTDSMEVNVDSASEREHFSEVELPASPEVNIPQSKDVATEYYKRQNQKKELAKQMKELEKEDMATCSSCGKKDDSVDYRGTSPRICAKCHEKEALEEEVNKREAESNNSKTIKFVKMKMPKVKVIEL